MHAVVVKKIGYEKLTKETNVIEKLFGMELTKRLLQYLPCTK